MGPRHKHMLISLAFLTFISTLRTNEINNEENVCSFASKKQILTCENITMNNSNIENLITNTTQVLIIRNSSNLKITLLQHTEPYLTISSYQLLSNIDLEIEPFAFSKLVTLKYLKIIDNHYNTIKNNTFYGLDELEVLDLNNNSIQHLEVDSFNRLINLQTLELTHNNFKVIPAYAFQTMKNLKSLFLYHNAIEVLETNCLAGLINLSVLDLTYNRLKQIDTRMFNDLKQLSHLYLSFNQIEVIENDFESTTIGFLYLQNNRLKTVSDTIFNSLSNLVDLDISHNKINEMAPDAFYNLTKLINLNYKANNLGGDVDLVFNGTKPFITA